MIESTINWYSASEALPAESGEYLTLSHSSIATLNYSAKHQMFNAIDNETYEEAKSTEIDVVAWAHITNEMRRIEKCLNLET